MPSWSVHLAVAKEVNKKLNLNKDLFYYGNLIPDVDKGTIINRYTAHFYDNIPFPSCPKETKWLKNIKTDGERMNNLITDLLELKDISKIIELSLLTFDGKAYEKNIKIDYQIKDTKKIKLVSFNITN